MSSDTVTALLSSTTAASNTRCCFLLRVKQDKLAEYIEVHQHVWDSMKQALTDSGWKNYSLFIQPHTGMIVGYFESDDVAQAIKNMSNTDINTQWQSEMAQYFLPPDGGTNEYLHQYFYLP